MNRSVRDDRAAGAGPAAADGAPLQVPTKDNLQRVYQQDVAVLEHARRGVRVVVN